ncbi:hypothetical protein ACFX2J_004913 [Malus domestica]
MHPTPLTLLPASTLAALVLSLSTARQPDTERAKASEKRSHRSFLLQNFLASTPLVVATPNPLDLPIPILFRWV